jgi:hypothetical protein
VATAGGVGCGGVDGVVCASANDTKKMNAARRNWKERFLIVKVNRGSIFMVTNSKVAPEKKTCR